MRGGMGIGRCRRMRVHIGWVRDTPAGDFIRGSGAVRGDSMAEAEASVVADSTMAIAAEEVALGSAIGTMATVAVAFAAAGAEAGSTEAVEVAAAVSVAVVVSGVAAAVVVSAAAAAVVVSAAAVVIADR
jgi:hypothetical protein